MRILSQANLAAGDMTVLLWSIISRVVERWSLQYVQEVLDIYKKESLYKMPNVKDCLDTR